ncbi:MAG: diguanylate cyclase [Deltaproteobacteria bacterium]|jgi:diguanylate cyclase (GGDEF)-like protein/PAS domain S-box-containing protein|nr:diguanylate cyclase [Deltaproteobacteria bacterium]
MEALHSIDLDILLDTIPNPVFVKDEDLRFIFVNRAYEKMFNVNRYDILGRQVIDLEYLPEEDKAFYQKEDMEMIRLGKTSHHIFDYLYKGKMVHKCLYWSSGFMQRDGQRRLIGIIVDINKQSDSVRELRDKLRTVTSEKNAVAKQSKIDSLTQLYSRRTFDETLQSLAFSGNIFSCIMFDIDHFKRVNDSFGHAEGDAVLKKVASSLKKTSRKPDNAYRYGGEEFAVLLPGTNLADAVIVAERIRCHVCENVFLPDGQQMTISAGCSEYRPGESGMSVVVRADKALYAAKNSGRNRVCTE